MCCKFSSSFSFTKFSFMPVKQSSNVVRCPFQLLRMCFIHRFTVDKDQLVVADVSDNDGGTYTCLANTTLDNVSASAVLSVVGKN